MSVYILCWTTALSSFSSLRSCFSSDIGLFEPEKQLQHDPFDGPSDPSDGPSDAFFPFFVAPGMRAQQATLGQQHSDQSSESSLPSDTHHNRSSSGIFRHGKQQQQLHLGMVTRTPQLGWGNTHRQPPVGQEGMGHVGHLGHGHLGNLHLGSGQQHSPPPPQEGSNQLQ